MKQLKIDPEKCIGCRSCELACALENEGVLATDLSRISVIRFLVSREWGLASNQVFVCRQCQDGPCLEVCPENALYREDSHDKTIRVDKDRCTGCSLCAKACPFGAIRIEPVSKKAVKCELCNGDPACVDICPSAAITFAEQIPFFSKHLALQMRGITILKHGQGELT